MVLIDFWAPDCAPCVDELAELQALSQRAGARVALIGVAMAYSDPDVVRAVAARAGVTFPLVWDRRGTIADELGGVRVTPTHLFIGVDGRIDGRIEGRLPESLSLQFINEAALGAKRQ